MHIKVVPWGRDVEKEILGPRICTFTVLIDCQRTSQSDRPHYVFFQQCESTLFSTVSPTLDFVSVLNFADLVIKIESSSFSLHLEKLINLDSWATFQTGFLNFLIYEFPIHILPPIYCIICLFYDLSESWWISFCLNTSRFTLIVFFNGFKVFNQGETKMAA